MSKEALLVIDLQACYLNYDYSETEVSNMIHKYNETILDAYRNGLEVIYIKNIYTSFLTKTVMKLFFGGIGIENTKALELHQDLAKVSENIFIKNKPNAFLMDDFKKFVQEKNISNFYIMGIDGSFCINDTAIGGKKLGMNICVIEDLCFSFKPKTWVKKKKKLKKIKISFAQTSYLFKTKEKVEKKDSQKINNLRV